MSEDQRYTVNATDGDGSFEIRLRLLGNEVFAISVSADPLDKKWVSWALIISFVTVFGLSIFGEPLAEFYQSLTDTESSSQLD